jgi:hypothetical protein
MFISYIDETGDDGYPKYSSRLFVMTNIYMHFSNWRDNFSAIHNFRKLLYKKIGFPSKIEFHTQSFLTDKNPYRKLGLKPDQKREIVFDYLEIASKLKIRIINVVIDKAKIRNEKYDVLEKALTYSIQRLENFCDREESNCNLKRKFQFAIIADEGRIGKMVSISRKIQRYNPIPSNLEVGTSYKKEIERMIEDPLPKDSKQSYFIQLADTISFIIFLYAERNLCNPPIPWANRICNVISPGDELLFLDKIKKVINLEAHKSNEYGVVYYPK